MRIVQRLFRHARVRRCFGTRGAPAPSGVRSSAMTITYPVALPQARGGWPVVVPSASFRTFPKMLGRRAMLLPAQYAWFEPVLIASIVVFIIGLVGNKIAFGNRYLGALASAILFALVFGALVYFGYGNVSMSVTTTPSATAPAQTQK